jgi:hypothetical protein
MNTKRAQIIAIVILAIVPFIIGGCIYHLLFK